MAHDVFVSYSSKDKAIADTIVAALENNQMRCWYAPRDIQPSEDWGEAITKAIESAKIFLIIFSASANRSQRVLDELNLAITQQAVILPFRIENLEPVGAMKLHLSSRHWLDAYEPSWESHIRKLVKNVSSNLKTSIEDEAIILPARIEHKTKAQKNKLPRILAGIAIGAVVITAGWVGLSALNKSSSLIAASSTAEALALVESQRAEEPEATKTSAPPTSEPTSEPTPEPTLHDSSIELGPPDYETDFSSFGIESGEWDWNGQDADGIGYISDDGKLIVKDFFSLLHKGTKKYINSFLEVDAKLIKKSGHNPNEIILFCRADFPGGGFSGYSAGLTSEGNISIKVQGPFSPEIEIFSRKITEFDSGQVYRLRFDCEGKDFRFFVNGEMIANIPDTKIYSGNIGLSSQGTVEFDNFKLWLP